jgi:predicted RNA binding protein YcfA (HicA-like mRNA interferase family)
MARVPVLRPREIARVLQAMGFAEIRHRGSHKQYRHADGRGTTVPFHGSRDVSPFLLRQIIKDIRSTPEEFLRHL